MANSTCESLLSENVTPSDQMAVPRPSRGGGGVTKWARTSQEGLEYYYDRCKNRWKRTEVIQQVGLIGIA